MFHALLGMCHALARDSAWRSISLTSSQCPCEPERIRQHAPGYAGYMTPRNITLHLDRSSSCLFHLTDCPPLHLGAYDCECKDGSAPNAADPAPGTSVDGSLELTIDGSYVIKVCVLPLSCTIKVILYSHIHTCLLVYCHVRTGCPCPRACCRESSQMLPTGRDLSEAGRGHRQR